MFDWLKRLLGRKVDTSPEIPEAAEPTLGELIVKLCHEEESTYLAQAHASESTAHQVKLKAKREAIEHLRLKVQSLMEKDG